MLKKRTTYFVFLFLFSIFSLNAEENAPKPNAAPTEQAAPQQNPAHPSSAPEKKKAPSPAPAAEPKKEEPASSASAITGSYESAFTKMLLTLGALVVLIILSVWMLRRISSGGIRQGSSSKSMKILERKALSAKSALYIIEVGGKKVLISESQLEVRPITTLEEVLETEEDK